MFRTSLILMSSLLAAGCVSASAAVQPEWVLRPDGAGPVRVGMTLEAAGRVLGESLRADYDVFEGCDFVVPATAPLGVSLMVLSDTVVRVDIDTGAVATHEGIRIGDTEARVLEAYRGQVTVDAHPYGGPVWHYLIVDPPGDTLHRMIFETDGTRVTSLRAGLRDAVDLIEGCA
ncbi:MAG TPA: hypothetical protein VFT96_10200 [Gemmatimonadaceae bacterium]|nr:hypothetical protein [Gemmatimonadaceae bacterium]